MILSFFGSLLANVIILVLVAFTAYYFYNKKAGNVKDIKEAVTKFIEEVKSIPSKIDNLLKKLQEIKEKLDAISKLS